MYKFKPDIFKKKLSSYTQSHLKNTSIKIHLKTTITKIKKKQLLTKTKHKNNKITKKTIPYNTLI